MEIIVYLISMFAISLAAASISYTISKTDLCSPIRKLFGFFSFSKKLINCPYCVSHWISFGMIYFVYRTFSFEVFVLSFAMVTLSSFWIGKISRSFDFV